MSKTTNCQDLVDRCNVIPLGSKCNFDPRRSDHDGEDEHERYDVHERTFLTEPDCFLTKDCDFVATRNYVEASYGGILKTHTTGRSEYRWVPYGDDGDYAFLHRTWLVEEAWVSLAGVAVNDQFYFGATLPWDKGALRLGTTWIAAEIFSGSVPEKTALNLMISSMQAEGENLDEYLANQ